MCRRFSHVQLCDVLLCVQVVDRGILFHPGSYCRDLWNILDAVAVICALFAIAFM